MPTPGLRRSSADDLATGVVRLERRLITGETTVGATAGADACSPAVRSGAGVW
jgi:hypothetical protein